MSYEAIRQAALKQDAEALKRILGEPQNVSIDVYEKGLGYRLSAAAQLAVENNIEAVEFLRSHGASVILIAAGFARGGHIDMVNQYCDQYDVNFEDIACEFAVIRNIERVNMYRERYKVSEKTIAFGFAIGGHFIEAAQCLIKHPHVLNDIAKALAIAGYFDMVEEYRTNFGASIDWIAKGFAIGGHNQKVEEYREMGASVDEIAHGFAVSGRITEADNYRRDHGACASVIAHGFASAGYFKETRQYFCSHDADIDYIIRGLNEGKYEMESKRYDEFDKNILKIIENSYDGLINYAKMCFANPIEILEDKNYNEEKHNCMLLHEPSNMPVRVQGHGPFDLGMLLKCEFKLPNLQEVRFSLQQIAPDYVTRSELREIAQKVALKRGSEPSSEVHGAKKQCFTPGYGGSRHKRGEPRNDNDNNNNNNNNKHKNW